MIVKKKMDNVHVSMVQFPASIVIIAIKKFGVLLKTVQNVLKTVLDTLIVKVKTNSYEILTVFTLYLFLFYKNS